MASMFTKLNFVTKLAPDQKKAEEIKQICSHGGLYLGLILYTAVGAKIFQEIENPHEVDTLETYQALLIAKREVFLQSVWNESSNSANYREKLDQLLSEYESVVSEAVGAGVSVVDQNFTVSWDFIQSVFFSTTILTTIGYGNISPVTFPGRLFCIFFAIIGIPFTLSVIADIGQILATIISKLWDQYKLKIKPLLEKHNILKKPSEEEDEDVGFAGNIKTALGSLLVLSLFLSIGAYFFTVVEDLTFFDAFYFCFITMTTIGFGDIVPDLAGDSGAYMVLSTVYILVGMTVFTTIIEIVRRQYEESWKKMQELRAQIQAQLRLADHLRKLGEQGGLDADAAAELEAIRGNLAKYKGKMGKGFEDIAIDEMDWVDNNKRMKAVTIIFYETSL